MESSEALLETLADEVSPDSCLAEDDCVDWLISQAVAGDQHRRLRTVMDDGLD